MHTHPASKTPHTSWQIAFTWFLENQFQYKQVITDHKSKETNDWDAKETSSP